MNKPKIILIGGGGHCKSCIDVIELENKYSIAGIVDKKENIGNKLLGYPIIGCDDDLPDLIKTYKNALITVGQIKSAKLRIKLYNLAKNLGAHFPVITSPISYISNYANVMEGTIVMHHALVNAEVNIGINTIINSKALIEHEVNIGNHCHISTGTKINGQVCISNECFVGSGVTIANNIDVSNNVIIPAGKTIFKNINKAGTFITF